MKYYKDQASSSFVFLELVLEKNNQTNQTNTTKVKTPTKQKSTRQNLLDVILFHRFFSVINAVYSRRIIGLGV